MDRHGVAYSCSSLKGCVWLLQYSNDGPFDSPHLIANSCTKCCPRDCDYGCHRPELVHDMHRLYIEWFLISHGIFNIYN
jgi:hypothetical protein